MAVSSSIEWTQSTWNPLTGCTKISPGCAHCYAEGMARRLQAMGQPNYANGFRLTLHEHMLERPLEWKRPQVVFVNSMKEYVHRLDDLRRTPAAIKFVSLEPLLGPLPGLNLEGIDWVIAGGESGWSARPMQPEWVTDVRDQCVSAGVRFFFKQWGGMKRKKAGRLLDGRTWDEVPQARLPLAV